MAAPVPIESFDEFFRRDFGRLVAFLIKMGFGREHAQDAAAEAMCAAFRQWNTLSRPTAWVRSAAYRIATKQVRRDRDDIKHAIAGGWLEDINTSDTGDREDWSELLALLSGLPCTQRLVFVWRLDGFTPAEIALQLQMTPSTVRSTLRHARHRLKTQLGISGAVEWPDEGGDPGEHQF